MLNFERQIIAIARVEGHTTIYCDDGDIAKLAAPIGLEVIAIHQLPLPPEDAHRSRDREQQEDE